ncbi:MAG: hypothetical protein J6C46_01165 [Clostridia bacterium]|nr:hypothetical protein [Clostridia bacterium]
MSVFWRKKKKSDFEINKKITGLEELKEFLETADSDFIKVYCFPAYLACAYYFGTDKTKEKIEELIDETISKN